jgi:hypothetical protein
MPALLQLATAAEKKKGKPSNAATASKEQALEDAWEAFNSLPVGCGEDSAIHHFLLWGGGRVEAVESGSKAPDKSANYDDYRVLRLGRAGGAHLTGAKICLYFRGGFLVAKALVSYKDKANAQQIYRREIASGLQDPFRFPGLIKKVHWGKPVSPSVWVRTRRGKAPLRRAKQQESGLPKLRCGILVDDLPPRLAKKWGFNALLLCQNVGPGTLRDDLLALGFPLGPVAMVTLAENPRETTGMPTPLGLAGSTVVRVPLLDSPLKATPFRLKRGEGLWVWYWVPKLKSYSSVWGEVAGLWGVDSSRVVVDRCRIWDNLVLKSEKVEVRAK